ncbi:MAG: guanylate kinase [Dehalococcoidia bacterium]|nr:guanylate kinase [Dehalococcoidia bacterium]
MMSSNSNAESLILTPDNLVLVLSGPSGVGKDVALNAMKARPIPSTYVVTNTTRPQRQCEIDGEHYHFVSQAEFSRMIGANELLEYAEVYGNYYGVPKTMVCQALADGKDVIIKVDVQGALTIKKRIPDAVLIFLMPPSLDELANRLQKRGTENNNDMELRLNTARSEIELLPLFNYAVVSYSNRIEDIVDNVAAIITAEKLRVKSHSFNI